MKLSLCKLYKSEYQTWVGIRARCDPKKATGKAKKNYADRGIRVSAEWCSSFNQFLENMGPKPSKKHSIERINNDLGYSKENCRWATTDEQHRNMRSNVFAKVNGESIQISDLAKNLKMPHGIVLYRINSGWPIDRLTEPLKCRHNEVTFEGKSVRVADLARRLGIRKDTLLYRIKAGVPAEQWGAQPLKRWS